LAVLAAACSGGSNGPKVAAGAADPGPDLETFAAMLHSGTLDFNDPPPASPKDLAEMADLVVSATLLSVTDGPTLETSVATFQHAVVAAKVTQVHKGTLPAGSDGIVYIGFRQTAVSPKVLDSLLPKGTPALLYLGDFGQDPNEKNSEAGRPAGQPLYADRWPSLGFILQIDDQTTLPVTSGYVYPAPLSDYLPDRLQWPPVAGRREAVVNRTVKPEKVVEASSSS
jgi:hypothetical protein